VRTALCGRPATADVQFEPKTVVSFILSPCSRREIIANITHVMPHLNAICEHDFLILGVYITPQEIPVLLSLKATSCVHYLFITDMAEQ
jgi:hypothetical protein